jgi:hypothetical protein
MDWIKLFQDFFTIKNTEFPDTESAASIGVLFEREIKELTRRHPVTIAGALLLTSHYKTKFPAVPPHSISALMSG